MSLATVSAALRALSAALPLDPIAALAAAAAAAATLFLVGEVTRPFPPGTARGVPEHKSLLYRAMGLAWHMTFDEAFRYHLIMLRALGHTRPLGLRTFWMPRLLLTHPADIEYVLIATAMFLALVPSIYYVSSGMSQKFSSIGGYFSSL